MAIRNIAIACQGGGSHAAYAAGALPELLPRFENAAIARAGGKRSPLQEDGREHLNLAGISGTSGGAISAILAWLGYLSGGTKGAQARLDAFWDANCARQPGELIVNEMAQWMGRMLSVDLKFSPYLSPLYNAEQFTTQVWPQMAARWPPLRAWVREHYFQLRESIQAQVDFELVGAIGDFCSIPLEVKHWHACRLAAGMQGAAPAAPPVARQEIEDRILTRLETTRRLADWVRRQDLEPDCLLRAVFADWRDTPISFEPTALDQLADRVLDASYTIPQLLIGAVDVRSGAFIAFSSERAPEEAGISLDAVAASACLPWIFEAQQVKGTDPATQEARTLSCWDGLLSQNPPIRNFIADIADRDRKPDAVWILQINQDQSDFGQGNTGGSALQRYGSELWHRRDTLSGNLSLNQEIAFIEAINRRLDDPDQGGAPQDKPIEVARIVMDAAAVGAAAGRELGVFSKFDRNLALKDALVAHGRQQAVNFLGLRGERDRLCDELGRRLEQMGVRPGRGRARAAIWRPGQSFGGLLAPDVLALEGTRGPHPQGLPQASVSWHVSDAVVDGRVVGIRGRSGLYGEGGSWHLGETRLLDVREKDAAAAAATLQQKAQLHLPAGAERRHGQAGRTLH